MRLPIVYYSHFAVWDAFQARQQYLMKAMSAYTTVVYLNPTCRVNDGSDINTPRIRKITPSLIVIDNAFGFRASGMGRVLSGLSIIYETKRLHKLFRTIGIKDYAYWLSTPRSSFTFGMDCRRLIYDCIDPCLDEHSALHDRNEAEVVKQSQIVFCTAESLVDRMHALHPNAHLLPNACAFEDYGSQAMKPLKLPSSLVGKTKPIIGYMGTIDSRVDTALLTEAAKLLPDFTFVLVGRVNPDQEKNINVLRKFPNVVIAGAVSLEEGRAYTAAFDVGFIPFFTGEVGDAINPVKMYMYLMAGKPIVSTWIRECRRHTPYVTSAESKDDFICAIRSAVSTNSLDMVSRRIEFALQNTWEVRALAASNLIANI